MMKTLNFKQWLEHTHKAENYLNLEVNSKEYQRLLNLRDDSFFDIEWRGQRPGLDEAIKAASRAAKPLSAFEFLPSDFEIFAQRPPAAEEGSYAEEFKSMHGPDENRDTKK